MQKQTIISTPSIADINILFAKWKIIPGNESKILSDFYKFLVIDTVDRSVFLHDYCNVSQNDIKGNIVVIKVTPK